MVRNAVHVPSLPTQLDGYIEGVDEVPPPGSDVVVRILPGEIRPNSAYSECVALPCQAAPVDTQAADVPDSPRHRGTRWACCCVHVSERDARGL